MADVFISYSRKDRDTASQLAELLVQNNFTVWWDQNLRRGARFRKIIETELIRAKAVIVLWSERATQSRWVLDEADHAAEAQKLFPIKICECEIPLGFRQIHTTDLECGELSPKSPAVAKMLEDVAAFISTSTGDTQAMSARTSNLVRIAQSPLFVIHAITCAWDVERHLAPHDVIMANISYPWNDKILSHFEDGRLDLAIYNFNRAQAFIDRHPGAGFLIIAQAGRSMGGNNFSILAKTESQWEEIRQDGFAEAIAGATVGLPENSDMADVFNRLVGGEDAIRHYQIKIVDVPVTTGLEFFSLIPQGLLITGQNVRQCALAAGAVREVLVRSSIAPDLGADLMSASRNCIIASDRLVATLGGADKARAFGNRLWVSFSSNWADSRCRGLMLDQMVSGSYNWSFSEETVHKAIERILYESYRIGIE